MVGYHVQIIEKLSLAKIVEKLPKNPVFFCYVWPFFNKIIPAKQHCKSAKHMSLTAESDYMFYFFNYAH